MKRKRPRPRIVTLFTAVLLFTTTQTFALTRWEADQNPSEEQADELAHTWSYSIEKRTCDDPEFTSTEYPLNNDIYSVSAGDWDGDGDLDLAAVGRETKRVDILLNNGAGQYTVSSAISLSDKGWSIRSADFDADGDIDLTVSFGPESSSSGTALVLENDGTGNFSTLSSTPVGSKPYTIAPGDLDGDGDLDLVTSNILSDDVSVLLSSSSASVFSRTDYPVGDLPYGVCVADIDSDGDLDIIACGGDNGAGYIVILLNEGSGSFVAGGDYPAGNRARKVVASDIDSDGDLDIAAVAISSDRVDVLENLGDGLFDVLTPIPLASGPSALTAADIDGDADIDLIATMTDSNDLAVLSDDGSGTFVVTNRFPVGGKPQTVIDADLDGDGVLDLVAGSFSGKSVSVLLNVSCCCPFQCDLDVDGFLTALDLAATIDILFAGQPDVKDPVCPSPRADFDCDGFSTAIDLSKLIDHLFAGGEGPCDPCTLRSTSPN